MNGGSEGKLDEAHETHMRLFIVGPARSATSLWYFALRDVLSLPGFGESHLIPLLQRVIYPTDQYNRMFREIKEDLLVKTFPFSDFKESVFTYFRSFYALRFPHGWVDKTPTSEAVHGIGLIAHLFPDAKIILTKRNGLEVVQSASQKFGQNVATASADWRDAMLGVDLFSSHPQVFVIEHARIFSEPLRLADELCGWLGVPSQAPLLAAYIMDPNKRHERSVRRGAKELTDTDWSPMEKASFAEICGNLMRSHAYKF